MQELYLISIDVLKKTKLSKLSPKFLILTTSRIPSHTWPLKIYIYGKLFFTSRKRKCFIWKANATFFYLLQYTNTHTRTTSTDVYLNIDVLKLNMRPSYYAELVADGFNTSFLEIKLFRILQKHKSTNQAKFFAHRLRSVPFSLVTRNV